MLTPLLLALAASPQAHDHGVVALPTAARAQAGPVTAGELRGECFVKGVPVAAPGGGAQGAARSGGRVGSRQRMARG